MASRLFFVLVVIGSALSLVDCPSYSVSGTFSSNSWALVNPLTVTATNGSKVYSTTANFSNPGVAGVPSNGLLLNRRTPARDLYHYVQRQQLDELGIQAGISGLFDKWRHSNCCERVGRGIGALHGNGANRQPGNRRLRNNRCRFRTFHIVNSRYDPGWAWRGRVDSRPSTAHADEDKESVWQR